MITVPVQAYRFIVTILVGFGIAFLYDIISFAGLQGGKSSVKRLFFDLFFWIASIAFAFTVLFRSNYGEIRYYVFVGMIVGFVLYRFTLRRYVVDVLVAIKWILKRIVYMLGRCWRHIHHGIRIMTGRAHNLHGGNDREA